LSNVNGNNLARPFSKLKPSIYNVGWSVHGFNFENGRAKLFPLTFDNFFKEDEVYDLHVNNGISRSLASSGEISTNAFGTLYLIISV
jgi:predicted molibdopterin-dependent oxidoreductase YjgC